MYADFTVNFAQCIAFLINIYFFINVKLFNSSIYLNTSDNIKI